MEVAMWLRVRRPGWMSLSLDRAVEVRWQKVIREVVACMVLASQISRRRVRWLTSPWSAGMSSRLVLSTRRTVE